MAPPRKNEPSAPSWWLMAALSLCLLAVTMFFLLRFQPSAAPPAQAAEDSAAPSAAPVPTPTPEPTPTPTPEPDWSRPVPEGEAVDQEEWFADAVFLGDSRTDGFHLYSGVTSKADFIDHTGITVFEVLEGKQVIRRGEQKVSMLDALAEKTYGKVYISLGANELGYNSAENFGGAYGELVDKIMELQPEALVYIQSIIPVNTEKCKANDQPYYVTNENIAAYNAALSAMTAEKKVRLVNVSEALIDDTGEVPADLSSDGVHFKKAGYAKWLEYLTTHTGTTPPVEAPAVSETSAVSEAPEAAQPAVSETPEATEIAQPQGETDNKVVS